MAQSITHRPHLGESVTLNCVPPTSFPPADVEWVLKTQEGNIEPINYNNRISMDLEGLFLEHYESRTPLISELIIFVCVKSDSLKSRRWRL